MKILKKLAAMLSVGALSVSMLSVANIGAEKPASPAPAADHWTDDWLHVEGNKIKTKEGKEVWLTGVNWFGFNCNEVMFHGLDAGKDFKVIAQGIADRGMNVIRVPISTELLLSWKNGKPVKGSTNFSDSPYYINNPWFLKPGDPADSKSRQMDSMEIFDACMRMFKEMGLKVIVDVHSAKTDNSGHVYPLWYNGEFTTKIWIETQAWLADKYKNDDTIIGFDIKNEPHGKRNETLYAKWDDSKDEFNWRYAAEECGKAILAANPNVLILVEGIETYPKEGETWADPLKGWPPNNYYGAWWGGNFRGVKQYPITLKSPTTGKSQLVYSPHEYGPSVYEQAWFHDGFTMQSIHDEYMHDSWEYLYSDYPLLIGEWGGFMDGTKNQKWMEMFAKFMADNKIHHTYWCVNPNSGDTGGLLDHSWEKWDEAKMKLLDTVLWKNAAGKYQGLDHQIPLGKNGVNLNGTAPDPTKSTATTATVPKTEVTTERITTTVQITTAADTSQNKPKATVYGDVTLDGEVTMTDVIEARKYYVGLKNGVESYKFFTDPAKHAQAVVNGNCASPTTSEWTLADVLAIMRGALGENLPIGT